MKFTSEDLMKAMGLQVGDRVKTEHNEVFEIIETGLHINLQSEYKAYPIGWLIEQDFEILPRPKRVGDLKCSEFDCSKCPLRIFCGTIIFKDDDTTFYEILERYTKYGDRSFDQEIYDLLKARLDKEAKQDD